MSAGKPTRWILVATAIALLFAYPSIYTLSFYFNSLTFLEAARSAVTGANASAERFSRHQFVCSEEARTPDQLTRDRLADHNGHLLDRSDKIGSSWSDEGLYIMERPWRITEGLRDIVDANNEFLSDIRKEPRSSELCSLRYWNQRSGESAAPPISQTEMERRVNEHLADRSLRLQAFSRQLVAGIQKHEPYRWVVAFIAWADLLLEATGVLGIVLMIRHSSRLRKARREAKESGR